MFDLRRVRCCIVLSPLILPAASEAVASTSTTSTSFTSTTTFPSFAEECTSDLGGVQCLCVGYNSENERLVDCTGVQGMCKNHEYISWCSCRDCWDKQGNHKVDPFLAVVILVISIVGLGVFVTTPVVDAEGGTEELFTKPAWFGGEDSQMANLVGVAAFFNLFSYVVGCIVSLAMDTPSQGIMAMLLGQFIPIYLMLPCVTCGGAIGVYAADWSERLRVLMWMVVMWCFIAGFHACCFCLVMGKLLFKVISELMKLTLRLLKHGIRKDQDQDCISKYWLKARKIVEPIRNSERCMKVHKVVEAFVELFVEFVVILINFALQSVLVSFSLAAPYLKVVHDFRDPVVPVVKEALIWRRHLPSFEFITWLFDAASAAGGAVNAVGEHLARLMVNYSAPFTPVHATAYLYIAVMEIGAIGMVLGIVLSDVGLIVAPRVFMGKFTEKLLRAGSALLNYILEVLVSSSNLLLLTLLTQSVERKHTPENMQEWSKYVGYLGYGTICIYLPIAFIALAVVYFKISSGDDSGMQKFAANLMKTHGLVEEDKIITPAGRNSAGVFFLGPLFGIWTKRADEAFEIMQRAEVFRLSPKQVRRITVKSLLYTYYMFPFGAVFSKFCEYLNQQPCYVASQSSEEASWTPPGVILTSTYVAEYILLVISCFETLSEAQLGIEKHDDRKGAKDDNLMSKVLIGTLVFVSLLRLCVASFALERPQSGLCKSWNPEGKVNIHKESDPLNEIVGAAGQDLLNAADGRIEDTKGMAAVDTARAAVDLHDENHLTFSKDMEIQPRHSLASPAAAIDLPPLESVNRLADPGLVADTGSALVGSDDGSESKAEDLTLNLDVHDDAIPKAGMQKSPKANKGKRSKVPRSKLSASARPS